MPRYDYKCEAKGHVFEVTQSFSDDPVAFCPKDGSKAERQFSVPNVIYKGSGFYTTDYKNNGNSSGSSSSSDSGSDSDKSSSSKGKKSESKPDKSTRSSNSSSTSSAKSDSKS